MIPIDAFRESVTTIGGRTLAWLEWGAERPEPPVVCLHGAMGGSHVWDQMAARLAGDRRVIVPDLRGHGDSDWASPPAYGLRDYRADLEALLERLEVKRYSLVAHSLGALVALMTAGANPDAVRKLVVVDIAAKPPMGQIEHLREVGERGHRVLPDYESTVQAARTFLPEVDGESVSWMVPYLFKRAPGGHVPKGDPATLAGLERWNVEPWLARIRCPVLIVRGSASSVLSETEAEAMAERIDASRLVTIAGTGHQVMMQAPEAFGEAVECFLREGESEAGSVS